MSSSGVRGKIPTVFVKVTHNGEEYVGDMEEVARKMRTTQPTVKAWCIGIETPPQGYKVEFAYVEYKKPMTEAFWKSAPSENARKMAYNMKRRLARERGEL